MKALIVGRGTIGSFLENRLKQRGDTVHMYHYSDGKYKLHLKEVAPDVVFLAIPTSDKGKAAAGYIKKTVSAGTPIVTCEKGSFSYYAKELMPYRHLIGYSATVGGGTRLLKYMQLRNPNGQEIEVQAVLNGTLNFIFDKLQRGATFAEACHEAVQLGFAEPGAKDQLAIINGELKDVTMKLCVFFNLVLSPGACIQPDILSTPSLSLDQLQNAASNGDAYRFIVSFSNHHKAFGGKGFGGTINTELPNGWYVHAGFRKVTQSSKHAWLPSGAGNALQVTVGKLGTDGKYTLTGPGAGAGPTTRAMIDDCSDLLGKK